MHFNGSKHRKKHAALQKLDQQHDEILNRYETLKDAQASVELIRYPPWKLAAMAMLYGVMVGTKSGVRAYMLVRKYHRMEILSLLELALWNAKICDGLTFHSMQEMREYSILEADFEAQTFAKEMRISCGSQVVVPLVSAFLGPHSR